MIERQKISQRQAIYLLFSTSFGTIIFLHSAVIHLAGRGGWLAEILGIFLLIPLSLWILFLGRLAPGHTLLEILELTAGKITGKAVGAIYALISIAVTSLMLRSLAALLNIFIYPETPKWVFIIMLLALAILMADSGIEVQGRMGEVLQILLLTVFFIGMGIGVASEFNIGYIIPLFDRDVGQLAAGAYLTAGSVAEATLFLLVMVAALPRPAGSYWGISKGMMWVGMILGGAVLAINLVFGAEDAARISYGGVNVAENIQVGSFSQGVEVFVLVAYMLAVLLNVAAHTYASYVVAAGIFNNWRPRFFLAGTALVTVILANRIISFNEAYYYSVLLARYITLPFTILVLLLASLAVMIRGGKVPVK